MRRVQFAAAREGALHRQRDPVAKEHPLLFKVTSEVIAPVRKNVNEEASPGLEHADRFIDPREGPLQIVPLLKGILDGSMPIVLPEIKGRVGEDTVDGVVLEGSKEVEAICRIQQTKARRQSGLENLPPGSPARCTTRALFVRRCLNVALPIVP